MLQGTRQGMPVFMGHEQQAAICPRGPSGDLTITCSVLQRKAKKDHQGPVPVCPSGKFLPDPLGENQLFPEHMSKPASSFHTLSTPPRRCPTSNLDQCQGLPRMNKCPDPPWEQESFLHLAGHHCSKGLLQSTGIPCNTSAPLFLWLLPLAPHGV